MADNYEKEVYFDQYCKTCEHNDKADYEYPCTECLENPTNTETHRPVNWEPQDNYAQLVYKIVKKETEDMDAIYQDYIIQLVGNKGFVALQEEGLIETCGVIDGRQLYTLK